jgi:hypothetical protein
MKLLILFLLLPLLAFSQLQPKDSIALSSVLSQASGLSEYDYKLASKTSSELLTKYPNDSLVQLTQVRLFDMYVKKSKCSEFLTPKKSNICEKAMSFYTSFERKFNYPKIELAKGNIYYYTTMFKSYQPKTSLSDTENKEKAIHHYREYLKLNLADFEKREVNNRIKRLE